MQLLSRLLEGRRVCRAVMGESQETGEAASSPLGNRRSQGILDEDRRDTRLWGDDTVISFRETVDSVERLNELMKATADMRSTVDHCLKYLEGFSGMLDFAHNREFKSAGEALEYIDKVLIPQLNRIREALASESEPPLKRLDVARDLTARLLLRLKMLSETPGEGILP